MVFQSGMARQGKNGSPKIRFWSLVNPMRLMKSRSVAGRLEREEGGLARDNNRRTAWDHMGGGSLRNGPTMNQTSLPQLPDWVSINLSTGMKAIPYQKNPN